MLDDEYDYDSCSHEHTYSCTTGPGGWNSGSVWPVAPRTAAPTYPRTTAHQWLEDVNNDEAD